MKSIFFLATYIFCHYKCHAMKLKSNLNKKYNLNQSDNSRILIIKTVTNEVNVIFRKYGDYNMEISRVVSETKVNLEPFKEVFKSMIKWVNIKVCLNFRDYILWKIRQGLLSVRSLTYNEHMSQSYAIDFLLEPVFWFVDNFAQYLGKVFVFCVTVLTSAVVAIAYWVGLPYWWQRCPYTTVFLVIFGNWLLINIIFHYYKGVVTEPGYPPPSTLISDAASICRRCISPRPPRTHHCSVCDRCILAMDHHCPWLNNCVGYYNARFFFLYMTYMVIGVGFIITAGIDIGYKVIWLNDTGGIIPNNDPDLIGHPVRLNQTGVLVPVKEIVEYDDSVNFPREHKLPVPPITEAQRICAHPYKRKAVIFMALTCVAVFIALGTLTIIHGKNIGRGETSVEAHINEKLRKLSRGTYRNPYDFGKRKNWRLFLGLTQGRTFFRHVLLPSGHAPTGNGLAWHTVRSRFEDWP